MARRVDPSRLELLDLMDRAVMALERLIGRWHDQITAEVRDEIREVQTPLLRALIRAGRR